MYLAVHRHLGRLFNFSEQYALSAFFVAVRMEWEKRDNDF